MPEDPVSADCVSAGQPCDGVWARRRYTSARLARWWS